MENLRPEKTTNLIIKHIAQSRRGNKNHKQHANIHAAKRRQRIVPQDGVDPAQGSVRTAIAIEPLLNELARQVGVPRGLAELGVRDADVPVLAWSAMYWSSFANATSFSAIAPPS